MKMIEKYSGIRITGWRLKILAGLLLCGLIVGCSESDGDTTGEPMNDDSTDDVIGTDDDPMEDEYNLTTLVSGLTAPQGIQIDGQGLIWVAEQGTGASDGQISVIDQNGEVYPFLTNIPSAVEEGSAGSAHHLLIDNQTLWAVVGLTSEVSGGNLIQLDISNFTPGDTPLVWDQSFTVANVATLVLNHNFTNQTGQSNAYNLTKGPDGNIYIVDAAANAVVYYDTSSEELNVLAELPTISNTTGVGPPAVDAVPTGIIYADNQFLVSAFVGFPFTAGASRIFSVTLNGDISTFQSSFTGAVDITGNNMKYYVVEYARFSQGFQRNTGNVILLEGNERTVIAENLNYPNGICLDNAGNLYVASTDGRIFKLTKN